MLLPQTIAAGIIQLFCGATSRRPPPPEAFGGPAVFFANHSSNLDFPVVWAALPEALRARTRPVAARDYWSATPLRRALALDVFHALLIERHKVTRETNPLEPMLAALAAGSSLILFPEGTRSPDGHPLPFRPGIYHLARAHPGLPLIPAYLDNLTRILPKGEKFPLPLLASVTFGPALCLGPGEDKSAFLDRARAALWSLSGPDNPLAAPSSVPKPAPAT